MWPQIVRVIRVWPFYFCLFLSKLLSFGIGTCTVYELYNLCRYWKSGRFIGKGKPRESQISLHICTLIRNFTILKELSMDLSLRTSHMCTEYVFRQCSDIVFTRVEWILHSGTYICLLTNTAHGEYLNSGAKYRNSKQRNGHSLFTKSPPKFPQMVQ